MKRQKVLLAIGIPKLETDIKKRFNNKEDLEKFEILDDVIIRSDADHIFNKINNNNPDILVIKEGLPGESDILPIIYHIVKNYDIRIIFLAKRRIPGDKLLATLTMYSIYDILTGTELSIGEIVNIIKNPKEIKDVINYLPNVDNSENYDELLFETKEKEQNKQKEIQKEITIIDDSQDIVEKQRKELINKQEEIDTILGKQINVSEEDTIEKQRLIDERKRLEDEKRKLKKLLLKQKKLEIEKEKREAEEKLRRVEEEKLKKIKEAEMKKQYEEKEQQLQSLIEKTKEEESILKQILNDKTKEEENIKLKEKEIETEKDSSGILDAFNNIFKNNKNIQQNNKVSNFDMQRIISFYGVRPGTGNTFVSFNTAVELAKKGNKVLFIELDPFNPTSFLWYEIEDKRFGLEDALYSVNYKEYKTINESIIKKEDLLNQNSNLYNTHKQFPETLNFLQFKNDFIYSGTQQNINTNSLQQLLIYLLHHLNYNYIIIDINANIDQETIETLLLLSYKNVILFNQDVATVSTLIRLLNILDDKGLEFGNEDIKDFNQKNIYLLNNFSKTSKFDVKKMQQWVQLENLLTIDNNIDDIYDALFFGKLITSISKNKNFSKDLNKLIEYL